MAKGERGIWQRSLLAGQKSRDANDFARHIDYIHINPVKHGLVTRVRDWPHSSFHRMVERGIYPEDWAGDISDHGEAFGERLGRARCAKVMGFATLNPSYELMFESRMVSWLYPS